jgi:RNA polymerase sigma-70 factor (ECF subfamily)
MDYSYTPDKDLVNKIVKDGQLEAFGILYDRYCVKVYNKCLTFVESPSVAEDLTHDIFLKVFANLSKYKKRYKFSTWFYVLVYNMCIDYNHKQYLHKKVNYMKLEEIDQIRIKVLHCDTEQRLLSMDVDELKKVLKKLPPEDRLILLMKYQDGMSFKEIQEQLQISESRVKMRLQRTRERAMTIYDKLIKHYSLMTIEKDPHNPFQQLGEEQIPPGRIRKKVMTSAKFSQIVLQIVDLYFNKTLAMVGVLVNTKHLKVT